MRYLQSCVLLSSVLFSLTPFAWADEIISPNKVSLELKAEQWVTTKTALVTIGINAALTDKAFEKMHGDILTKLKQLSSQADWHITNFNRNVDKTGLEQLQAQAVARLPEGDISNLRNQVKSISKPGETYTVDDIQYSASEDEIKDAKTNLRENIYQQINAEITRLNKDFPDQKFYLNQADFMSGPLPMPMAANVYFKTNAVAGGAPSINVSDKLQMTANVVLASQPQIKK